ncbi:MAG: hypothetical protein ACREP9_00460, partial [Candidatus Dormibacteraceae bacterium]
MSTGLGPAISWLLERQNQSGWWRGENSQSIAPTAQYILLRRFLGLDLNPIAAGASRYLLHQQRKDGAWTRHATGPADLSLTIEGYLALRMLGLEPAADPMIRAREIIRGLGGIPEAGLLSKLWLALFGLYPWSQLPRLRPELLWLFGLQSIDSPAIAQSGIAAPLLIIASCHPRQAVGFPTDELINLGCVTPPPPNLAPQRASRRLVEKIISAQGSDDRWGGEWLASALSLIALRISGMEPDHPVLRGGLEALIEGAIEDSSG